MVAVRLRFRGGLRLEYPRLQVIKLFGRRPPGAHRPPGGPRALGPPGPENFDFSYLLPVLGAGRHPRGFPEPMGTILAKYQANQTHPDLFQSIFNVFPAFAIHVPAFSGQEIPCSFPPLESFNNLKDLIT